jgi:S1-C subfamily serine protease
MSFQGLNEAQSIGYIIPVLVIKHLLDDIELHNRYTAFPRMVFQYQSMENSSYRKYLKLNDEQHGILVTSVEPACVLSKILQEDDVIIAIDNVPIADDGTIYFRRGERLNFKHLEKLKFVGDTVTFTIIRQGKKYTVFRLSVFRIIEIISSS